MDFFAAQQKARRATSWLLFVYALAVACIFVAVYFAVSAGFLTFDYFAEEPLEQHSPWFSANRALWTLLITLVVVGYAALTKHAALRHGGAEVCEQLGATRVDFSTRRRLERRLLNVVEEMAVAAGTPVPAVYVLEREQAINAFVAGYALEDAAITVTQGALEHLNRDELQAIVAHEFSHVLNGDMRLNTRLIAALHGILALTIAARLLRGAFTKSDDERDDDSSSSSSSSRSSSSGSSSGSGKGNGGALILAILVAIVLITLVGAVGAFFARLIQAAVCRQRELLADAMAVQLTRDETQVSRALRRVEDDAAGSLLLSHNAHSVAHMFFAEGVRGWLASHPPLAQRILRLGAAASSEPLPVVDNPSGWTSQAPQRLLDVVGSLKRADLVYARELLAGMPAELTQALQDPESAEALIYLLLLLPDEHARREQWRSLEHDPDSSVRANMNELTSALAGLEPKHRLPLLELALPALHGMTAHERARLLANVDRLVDSDGKTELFEFVLQRLVRTRLATGQPALSRPPKARERRQAAAVVLSALARIEETDAKACRKLLRESSFDAGYDPPLSLQSPEESGLASVHDALDRLRHAQPKSQGQFLNACELLMLADGKLSLAECELFRAIVASLGVPFPARAVASVP